MTFTIYDVAMIGIMCVVMTGMVYAVSYYRLKSETERWKADYRESHMRMILALEAENARLKAGLGVEDERDETDV